MLIAVNAGNSHVLLGGYEEDEQLFAASIATEPKWTRDDYACKLQQVFGLYSVPVGRIRGAVVMLGRAEHGHGARGRAAPAWRDRCDRGIERRQNRAWDSPGRSSRARWDRARVASAVARRAQRGSCRAWWSASARRQRSPCWIDPALLVGFGYYGGSAPEPVRSAGAGGAVARGRDRGEGRGNPCAQQHGRCYARGRGIRRGSHGGWHWSDALPKRWDKRPMWS